MTKAQKRIEYLEKTELITLSKIDVLRKALRKIRAELKTLRKLA